MNTPNRACTTSDPQQSHRTSSHLRAIYSDICSQCGMGPCGSKPRCHLETIWVVIWRQAGDLGLRQARRTPVSHMPRYWRCSQVSGRFKLGILRGPSVRHRKRELGGNSSVGQGNEKAARPVARPRTDGHMTPYCRADCFMMAGVVLETCRLRVQGTRNVIIEWY